MSARPAKNVKRGICIAVVLLSGRSLLSGADVSLSFKMGLAYPFFSGKDYQDYLSAQEAAFLTNEGYFVDWGTRFSAKGLGFSTGASLTIGLSDVFALQPEIYLSRFGGCYGFDDSVNYGEVLYVDRLRSVEAMLLAALRFGRGSNRVSLFAGPDVAFRWGEVGYKVYQEGYLIGEGSWLDIQFASLFFNLVGGVGITYYLRNGLLFSLEGRYIASLSPVMNEDATGLNEWNQQAVLLLVGIGRILGGGGHALRSNRR